jgi:hypothetical protein
LAQFKALHSEIIGWINLTYCRMEGLGVRDELITDCLLTPVRLDSLSGIMRSMSKNEKRGSFSQATAGWGVRINWAAGRLMLLLWWALTAALQAEDYTYTINNGTVTIKKYTGSGGAVVITNLIAGLPVTSIGTNAFYWCTTVTSVAIPSGVTSIGATAFYNCTSLTNVAIPDSVISIGDEAFLRCSSLASLTIPNSIISIGNSAFYNCASLTSVTIPKSVTSIGSGPFTYCSSLVSINVETGNPHYSSVEGVLFDKNQNTLVQYLGGKGGSYTIPGSVTNLAASSFCYCMSLTNVVIPSSVTSIGDAAFFRCTGLTNVTIPNSVISIGSSAFYNCVGLTSFTIPNSVTSLGDTAFYGCNRITNVNIGNNLTRIGNNAFYALFSLTNIVIGNRVTNIGSGAFSYCANLSGVYFPGNAPSVGTGGVFYGANNAIVYYLPETTGWGSTFGERPTLLWNPQVQTGDASFGMETNRFGFQITSTNKVVIVVEACASLAHPVWFPLERSTITGGSFYFSDPRWTNYPARFYRVRWPSD